MLARDQLAPDVAASDIAAHSAGSWRGYSNACVPCDALSHVASAFSQCSVAPLLELPVNTNYVSVSEHGVYHASGGDRAGVKASGEAGPRGPARQLPPTAAEVTIKARQSSESALGETPVTYVVAATTLAAATTDALVNSA